MEKNVKLLTWTLFLKNCSTVTVLLKDELTKFIGFLSLNNPKFYIFIDFGNISKCRILNNTTFYSNSQNLTEIKNELLEAKLVNRILFTSGIQGKKLILIPLMAPYWLICWFYIATDMLSLFYWKEVISFDTIKCNLFIPKLNCLATRKNGFGTISWIAFTVHESQHDIVHATIYASKVQIKCSVCENSQFKHVWMIVYYNKNFISCNEN